MIDRSAEHKAALRRPVKILTVYKNVYKYSVLSKLQFPKACTRSVNKVMRLIQYNPVLTFKLQIEFVPFKIVPFGGYTLSAMLGRTRITLFLSLSRISR